MRKKKINLKLLSFFTTVCCLIMGLFIQTANGQNPCPGSNCVSGDIRITKVTLVQNNAAHSPLPNTCTPGQDNVPVALKVDFDVTSQTRYGFLVTADVYSGPAGGTLTKIGKIAKCYSKDYAQGPRVEYVDTYVTGSPILWNCGSRIQLQNVYTAWDNQSPNTTVCGFLNTTTGAITNCRKIDPKCRFYGPTESFDVVSPLIANFTVGQGGCTSDLKRTVTFTSTTTGGQTPYSYTWNFGDGSSTLTTTTNPVTHDYSAGTYNVTLTVSDAAAGSAHQTDAQTINGIVVASCCVGSTAPTGVTNSNNNYCSGGSTTLTETGGSLGTGGAYKWYTGGCGTENGGTLVNTGASITVSPTTTTTYYVRAEGTCGNTACANVIVTVKPVPGKPSISVQDNCGSSTLTASGEAGATFTWNDNTTTNPRTVTSGGQFTVTQTLNGCTSIASDAATAAPKTVPGKPTISVQNNCGLSTLTASGEAGAIFTWNDNTTTNPRTVTSGGQFTVTQTVNGCISPASDAATAAPKTVPGKPTISVQNNCGSSTLTASGEAGATFTWNDNTTTNPRTVTSGGQFTVTQTVNGCISPASDAATAVPKTVPGKPTISVQDNCGSSTLTASGEAGATFTWNDNTTTNPRTVTSGGQFTVTQTVNGCISAASDAATAAPKTVPGKPTISVQNNCNGTSTLTASGDAGASFNWSDNGTDNPHTVTAAGSYTVTQTTQNGCTSLASDAATAAPSTNPGSVVVNIVNPTCSSSTGTVTVTSPVGSDLQYSYNGGAYGPSAGPFTFTAGAGYSITVKRNNTTCTSSTSCSAEVQARTANHTSSAQVEQTDSKTSVNAYPNPFSSKVRFSIESPVSGKAVLNVYNITGQKLHTVYQGYLFAGRKQLIDYNAPSTYKGTLIYTLKIGTQQVNGKVVQIK